MPSIIPGAGRGIISGRRLVTTMPIETVPTILINNRISQATALKNYVFYSGEEHIDMISWGAGSLYNHQQEPSVHHYWDDELVKHSSTIQDLPYSNFTKTLFQVSEPVAVGTELSIYYGDNWFQRFNASHLRGDSKSNAVETTDHQGHDSSPPRVVEAQDMRRFGHCLSHVHVAASTVEHAGSGLFAGKPFVKGDVVVVSPVLTLPKSIIDSEEGVLRNYCFASRESNMVLFPLNNGAMINHNSAGPANVRIDWYSWLEAYRAIASKYHSRQEEGIDIKSGVFDLAYLLALSVEELFGYSFAALDLSFIATRDITADEEIFLDYGSEWEHAWSRYQQELSVFQSSSASQRSCSDGDAGSSPSDQCQALGDAPVFKQYIAVPEGFYPQHW